MPLFSGPKPTKSPFPYGNESKPKMLLDTLQRYRMNVIPPAEGQLHQPTSRPRRDDVEGHAIDWIACKNTACLDLRICTDSSKELGTDHDCLRVITGFQSLRDTRPRIVSGTRVLKSEPVLSDKLDQGILTSLADTHTKRPTVPRYRDTNATKELFRIAKRTRTAYTWKRALRARQQDYQSWREQRTAQAMEGDWQALKQSRPNTNKGWESKLAEHLQPEDPHTVLHRHYEEIFATGQPIIERSVSPPRSPDISDEELAFALRQGHANRSVGHDGVSFELLRAICEIPEGRLQLLAWYNQVLHEGTIPPEWLDSLMVLLPKTRSPEQAKDTRPIAIGCAAEKVYCRIILERTRHHITLRKPWQCAGARRQTCDFLYTLHKLFEEEREWSKGLCILKVDFKRAFDTVDRNRLLARLWELQGDSEEYRTWERLMTGTTFTMRSPWGQSTFHSTTGIRQGSIESPAFFGVLVEWVLEEITVTYRWKTHVSTYGDLNLTQAAFMDDLLLS